MLKVEALKAMDMMLKDTKGIKNYIGDVISVKVENIYVIH
jgi:hypothetical protein